MTNTEPEPNFIAAIARFYVDNLESAIPFYRELVGEEPHYFEFRNIRLAKIGPCLLIEGADDEVRSHAATIAVNDIATVAEVIEGQNGILIEGPAHGPNGPRLIAQHPDGAVVEYIQRR